MAIEKVGFPINIIVISHIVVLIYQRVDLDQGKLISKHQASVDGSEEISAGKKGIDFEAFAKHVRKESVGSMLGMSGIALSKHTKKI